MLEVSPRQLNTTLSSFIFCYKAAEKPELLTAVTVSSSPPTVVFHPEVLRQVSAVRRCVLGRPPGGAADGGAGSGRLRPPHLRAEGAARRHALSRHRVWWQVGGEEEPSSRPHVETLTELTRSSLMSFDLLQLWRHVVRLHEAEVSQPGGWSSGRQRAHPEHRWPGGAHTVLQRRHSCKCPSAWTRAEDQPHSGLRLVSGRTLRAWPRNARLL